MLTLRLHPETAGALQHEALLLSLDRIADRLGAAGRFMASLRKRVYELLKDSIIPLSTAI